ncbi:MAG TPA: hypothetical protein PK264_22160 [Hyphomicrobiaceae bacterium]|nr:hypothetical protein [Hyphomicrobiaceae bacterium]
MRVLIFSASSLWFFSGVAIAGPREECLEQFEPQSRIEACTEALKANPKDLEVLVARAMGNLFMGRTDEARADVNAGLAVDPKFAPLYDLRGAIHLYLEKTELAIADGTKALELAPDLHETRRWVAVALFDLNRRLEGLSLLTAGIRRYPNDPGIAKLYVARAQELQKFDGLVLALYDYGKVVELDGDHLTARIERAKIYRLLGDYQRAIADLAHVIELRGQKSGVLAIRDRLDLVTLLAATNDLAAAAKHAREVVEFLETEAAKKEVSEYDQLLWRARARITGNVEPEKALSDLDQIFKSSSDDADAYLYRAMLHNIAKRFDAALSDCKAAIYDGPHDAEALRQIKLAHYQCGIAHEGRGAAANAVAAYKSAAAAPGLPEALVALKRLNASP